MEDTESLRTKALNPSFTEFDLEVIGDLLGSCPTRDDGLLVAGLLCLELPRLWSDEQGSVRLVELNRKHQTMNSYLNKPFFLGVLGGLPLRLEPLLKRSAMTAR